MLSANTTKLPEFGVNFDSDYDCFVPAAVNWTAEVWRRMKPQAKRKNSYALMVLFYRSLTGNFRVAQYTSLYPFKD
jgi:hypothetical protein